MAFDRFLLACNMYPSNSNNLKPASRIEYQNVTSNNRSISYGRGKNYKHVGSHRAQSLEHTLIYDRIRLEDLTRPSVQQSVQWFVKQKGLLLSPTIRKLIDAFSM